jgi:Zn finger protein HypA/HybF involved in hydrogenase expression
MADLLAAQRHAAKNRAQIEASSACGCFHCMQIFPPEEIVAWTGFDLDRFDDPDALQGDTALCPRCGSESVLGDGSGLEISPQFLAQMHEAWFQKTIIRPKARPAG